MITRFRTQWLVAAMLVVLLAGVMPQLTAQSLDTGEIAGTVADSSHAVVPDAAVTLKSLDTGSTQTAKTGGTGLYRFPLLKPGNYKVTVKQSGFSTVEIPALVSVGQTTRADITLSVSATGVVVEVSGAAPLVDTNSASISTPFSQQEVALLPNAGGDITNIAQTAPGAQMNNTGGYGNFTMNGLPATSNLFTVNGENDMDPYFNINNSGATNLTLGSNEIQEATVIANAYSGEYGQLSGAQVTYVTKSGSNALHGNAQYWWNGRTMNSNDWMSNNSYNGTPGSITPRPFSNANQWAAAVGGPIIKNKTFFFVDTEGLRFLLPNTIVVNVPTPAFATAVLNNVAAKQPAELPLYTQMMNLFANAPGAGNATPLANNSECAGLALTGFDPTTQNCFATYNATPSALGKEWILAVKIDQNLGQNDKLFGRYKLDHGVQPTYLDPINSKFDALSSQPAFDWQVQETHVFSPTKTNEFTAALSHYVAQFAQNEASALSTFPQSLQFSGANTALGPQTGGSANIVGEQFDFPQGRNITQYQFMDNFSWTRGSHGFKFGANFRRYDVSDHNFFYNNSRTYFSLDACQVNESPCLPADKYSALQMFSDGVAGQYRRADNLASDVPVALWGLGVYGMDTWKVKPNLTLTLALRVERNSNPVCQSNCFANFKTDWSSLASVTAGANAGNIPYTSDIIYKQHQSYHGVDALDWSPRIGFSWSPLGSSKSVLSGGFGLFYDNPPAGMVDDLLGNPPVSVAIRVRPTTGTLPFDPSNNGSVYTWTQSAQAFNSGFASGGTYSQIAASLVPFGVNFAPPGFTALNGTIQAPMWKEWNLQLQQQISQATVLIVNYVGNSGSRLLYTNGFNNAYDGFGLWPAGTLPAAPAVPNYATVSTVQNGAISNYNGLTVSLKHNFSKWVSAHANYTWAHNLDELSNGGLFTYGDSLPLNQLCPQSLRSCNYGSSDYDIRNSFNADFVVHPSYHFNNGFLNYALGGWEWSGKLFWRGGLPFSIVDGNLNGGVVNGTATVLATPTLSGNAPGQLGCGEGAASIGGTATPCLNAAAFLDTSSVATSGYSPQRRNQYVGPHFFDMDMGLFKNFKLGERVQFGVGAQAFNVFNHPNFSNPDNTLGDSTFGQINVMQPMPTSPYGVFLGFDSSVRVVQVSGKLTF
jgi:Carboxypeptidase regulatory-like domain